MPTFRFTWCDPLPSMSARFLCFLEKREDRARAP